MFSFSFLILKLVLQKFRLVRGYREQLYANKLENLEALVVNERGACPRPCGSRGRVSVCVSVSVSTLSGNRRLLVKSHL